MRKMFALFLGGLALAFAAGSAQAQETVIPTTPEMRGPIASVLQTSCGHGDCGACSAPACPQTCKSCCSFPDKKIVNHTVFASRCIDYCLPKCPGLFECLRHRGCDSGNSCASSCPSSCGSGGHCGFVCPDIHTSTCGTCSHVRTKHVLLKRVVPCEYDTFKCVVTERPPSCAPACPAACGTPGEMIPAPKGKTMPPATGRAVDSVPAPVAVPAAAAVPATLPPVPAALAPALPSAAPVVVAPNP